MKRSLLALVLLLVAAGVPCVLWFVSGSREAEREATRVLQQARDGAQATARTTAEQLGARLEKIRTSESQRPYFHYQNLMHDPRGASQGLSVVPSPLAQGPAEPLILAHFQIDADGRVSMPTINDDLRELSAPDASRQQSLRNAIKAAVPALMRDGAPRLASLQSEVATRAKPVQVAEQVEEPAPTPLPAPTTPPRAAASTVTATETVAPPPRVTRTDMLNNSTGQQVAMQQNSFNVSQQQMVVPKEVLKEEEPAKVQKLDPAVFAQNSQSNVVYTELKQAAPRRKTTLPSRRAPEVEIATRDFTWTSVVIDGKSELAALRPVVTPDGAVVQGFLLSDAALQESLRGGARLHEGGGAFAVGNTGWSLDVDDRAAVAGSLAQANEVRRAFQRTFYGGLTAAALAIIAVAVLVWRTERLARERAQFAAAAAHELRTPLAGLRLYGDMLAHQLGDPEQSRAYAQHVSEEADRLGRVVANMLEFTRLERGSLVVKPEPGDLAGVVRECVDQLRPALEAAGCNVELKIADDLPRVSFDRDAVHHIVQNLVDNAEKYSRPSADRKVEIELARANGHAMLTVSDRGVGLDARTARHLFLPFERGHTNDAPAGLGLGLVLVKALAEAHGGDVSWSARNGGGTSFCVRLPAFYTP